MSIHSFDSGLPEVIKELTVAPQGLDWGHAEAGTYGEMESGLITFTDVFNPNFADMYRVYARNVEIDIVSMQAGWEELQNAAIRARQFLIARAIMDDDNAKLYFVNDTVPFANPASGSNTLGQGYKFLHNMEKSTMQYILSTQLSLAQAKWQDDNQDATVTESAGSTLGLDPTVIGYDVSRRSLGNVYSIQVQNTSGVGFEGTLNDVEVIIESYGEKPRDLLNRNQHKKVKVSLKGASMNIKKTNRLAWGTTILEDAICTVTLPPPATGGAARVLVLNSAAFKTVMKQGHKERHIEFEHVATLSRNALDFTNVGTTNTLAITPVGLV